MNCKKSALPFQVSSYGWSSFSWNIPIQLVFCPDTSTFFLVRKKTLKTSSDERMKKVQKKCPNLNLTTGLLFKLKKISGTVFLKVWGSFWLDVPWSRLHGGMGKGTEGVPPQLCFAYLSCNRHKKTLKRGNSQKQTGHYLTKANFFKWKRFYIYLQEQLHFVPGLINSEQILPQRNKIILGCLIPFSPEWNVFLIFDQILMTFPKQKWSGKCYPRASAQFHPNTWGRKPHSNMCVLCVFSLDCLMTHWKHTRSFWVRKAFTPKSINWWRINQHCVFHFCVRFCARSSVLFFKMKRALFLISWKRAREAQFSCSNKSFFPSFSWIHVKILTIAFSSKTTTPRPWLQREVHSHFEFHPCDQCKCTNPNNHSRISAFTSKPSQFSALKSYPFLKIFFLCREWSVLMNMLSKLSVYFNKCVTGVNVFTLK